jgi:hypothetical protein
LKYAIAASEPAQNGDCEGHLPYATISHNKPDKCGVRLGGDAVNPLLKCGIHAVVFGVQSEFRHGMPGEWKCLADRANAWSRNVQRCVRDVMRHSGPNMVVHRGGAPFAVFWQGGRMQYRAAGLDSPLPLGVFTSYGIKRQREARRGRAGVVWWDRPTAKLGVVLVARSTAPVVTWPALATLQKGGKERMI